MEAAIEGRRYRGGVALRARRYEPSVAKIIFQLINKRGERRGGNDSLDSAVLAHGGLFIGSLTEKQSVDRARP